MVASMIEHKKGISMVLKASVEHGRLIVSLAFDKRYKNYIPKIKGLSIEAATIKDELTGKFKKGRILGLTHAINQNLGNPRAVRLA